MQYGRPGDLQVCGNSIQRPRPHSCEGKHLMDKTKITGLEKCKASFRVSLDMCLVLEWIVTSHQISSIQDGVLCAEHIQPFEQVLATDLPTAHQTARIREPRPLNLPSLQSIGTHDPHRGVLLGKGYHPF